MKKSIMSRMGMIFLTWRRYNQKLIKPFNITLKQLYVLKQLDRKRFLYPAQISEMLFADRPTTTTILKNLEKREWIRKERDPENGKRLRIFLTEQGKEKLFSIPRNISDENQMDFNPYSCFTKEEMKDFEQLLKKLSDHMELNQA